MNRRSLVLLFIGAMGMLAGLWTLSALREDRCLDAGGKWLANARSCTGPAGSLDVARGSDVLMAVFVGVVLAFMLFRASTFAQSRR